MNTSSKFYELFAGREDAYGSDEGYAVHEPVTQALIEGHLKGNGIGIYPVYWNDISLVRWGCCDIDTGDWDEAYMLALALKGMGIHPYVERSRSKGWHIWVFADRPVLPKTMRRALKVAYAAIDLPAKEANPKSENLRADQLGNYVRLPYKGWFGDSPCERQVMMKGWNAHHDGEPLPLSESLQNMERTPAEVLEHWVSRWYEPDRPVLEITPEEEREMQHLEAKIVGSLKWFFRDGPKQADRSAALQALAYGLANQGFSASQVFSMVRNADVRWGKYSSRPNGEVYILDIVERAFRG